jgi:type I restriction enzyme, S subunit
MKNGKLTVDNNKLLTRRYGAHKDSGVEWLGDVPEHWKLKRVKELGNLVLGKMLDNKPGNGKYLKKYLKSKNIKWLTPNLDNVEEMYFSLYEISLYRIKNSDLLFSEGGEVGKTSYWTNELDECYIQNSVHKFTTNCQNYSRYFLYLSFAAGHSNYYDSIVCFVSIKHLTKEKLSRIIWLSPPIKEQKTIAAYLDTKTAQIDRKIELLSQKATQYGKLKQSLVNETVTRGLDKTVSMKNSGIEWIGEVPAHWDVKRVKELFEISRGRVIAKTELANNGKFPVYSSQTKNDGCLGYINTFDYNGTYITWTTDGVNAGTVFLRRGKFNCTNICGTLKPKRKNCDIYYLLYALQIITKHNKRIDTNGAKIMSNEMMFIKIAVPPINEQRAIANYLNKKTIKIDKIVSTIKSQIEKLKELRKTLINDVVIGKIKVVKEGQTA